MSSSSSSVVVDDDTLVGFLLFVVEECFVRECFFVWLTLAHIPVVVSGVFEMDASAHIDSCCLANVDTTAS